MIEAYPLKWPEGYPRTKFTSKSKFHASFSSARDGIISELRLMGATLPIISSNIALRKDGLPYSGMAQPADKGIAVYFVYKKKQHVLACDRWNKVEDNLRAVELAISAMRGLERWGVSQIMERAFSGFAALPAPEEDGWWSVLGVPKNVSLDVAELAYKAKIRYAHPDAGGSAEVAAKINRAIAQARAELR
jgi:hypothetical protein